jgi:ketosteroid isomerase-like protein
MTDRPAIQALLEQLYAARVRGDLDAVCSCFDPAAKLRISGASDNHPISVAADGSAQVRRLLSMMIKSFKLSDYEPLSFLIDGTHAAVHWRARINSRITGASVPTELVDIIEVRDRHISRYTEFFVAC